MNASISVICYRSKTLSNGEHPLMLQISKDDKRKCQSLGISINPEFWDFTKCRPKANCPNGGLIQKIILDKRAEIQRRILELNAFPKDYTSTTLLKNDERRIINFKTVGGILQ